MLQQGAVMLSDLTVSTAYPHVVAHAVRLQPESLVQQVPEVLTLLCISMA